MSEDLLKNVKNMLAFGKGDANRLREIMSTIKGGEPLLMSDYKYLENLISQNAVPQQQEKDETSRQNSSQIRNETLEILRIRLAEGHITIDEFKELKKVLIDE